MGGLTGMGPKQTNRSEHAFIEEEQSQIDDYSQEHNPGRYLNEVFEKPEEFKAFEHRSDSMQTEEDQILNEKWRQEERETRLAHKELN